ncbi:MAG: helix-turn-helix transcriptional regulator [Anaerolineaceae bacterium]
MSHSSIEEITQFLSNHAPSTVFELSKNLNLSKADIRYHLKKLRRLDVIISIQPNKKYPMRGRPATRFTIKPLALPNNYAEIVKILIPPIEKQEKFFMNLSRSLFTDFNINQDMNLIHKMNDLTKELNFRNYDSRWETRKKGPIIIIDNCPYRALLHEFPGFCLMDQQIISQILSREVEHLQSFQESSNCRFQIKLFE